jgi:AI-2 transport protein TqsA
MPDEARTVGPRVLITLAAIVIILAGLRAAGTVAVPFLLSVFIAILTAPAVIALKKHRVPEFIAVTLVIICVVIVLAGLVIVLGGSVNGFIEASPRYQERLDVLFEGLLDGLEPYGIGVSRSEIMSLVNPGAALGIAGRALGQLAGILSNTFLVLLTVVFMLFEVAVVPAKLRLALDDENADLHRFTRVVKEVKGYIAIRSCTSIATGVLIGGALALLGVDFPVLWGVLAFALNYIPNIGSIIAAVPPVLLAVVQHGPGSAAVVALVFLVTNMTLGNLIEPRLMGRRLGLSPLVVFLSLVFWGWMWGPLGMLLSVPLTMVVKILFEHSDQFRGAAVLMSGAPETQAKSRKA